MFKTKKEKTKTDQAENYKQKSIGSELYVKIIFIYSSFAGRDKVKDFSFFLIGGFTDLLKLELLCDSLQRSKNNNVTILAKVTESPGVLE